jgi:hypothetical protein
MTPFEYASVILSVVMGLGLSHLLTAYVELIQARGRVRFYWVHTVWAVMIFAMGVLIWWAAWGLRGITVWNFFTFMLLLLEPVCIFVAAAFLVPRLDPGERLDLREHFYGSRGAIFGAIAALIATVLTFDGVVFHHVLAAPNLFMAIFFALSVSLAIVRRPWYHALGVAAFATLLLSFIVRFALRLGGGR